MSPEAKSPATDLLARRLWQQKIVTKLLTGWGLLPDMLLLPDVLWAIGEEGVGLPEGGRRLRETVGMTTGVPHTSSVVKLVGGGCQLCPHCYRSRLQRFAANCSLQMRDARTAAQVARVLRLSVIGMHCTALCQGTTKEHTFFYGPQGGGGHFHSSKKSLTVFFRKTNESLHPQRGSTSLGSKRNLTQNARKTKHFPVPSAHGHFSGFFG